MEKTYKIQNLTFTYKKSCFKLSMESDKIKDDFEEVCKKFKLKELEKIVKSQYVKNVKVFQDVAKTGEGMTELELLGLIEDKDMDLFSEMAMSNQDYPMLFDSLDYSLPFQRINPYPYLQSIQVIQAQSFLHLF